MESNLKRLMMIKDHCLSHFPQGPYDSSLETARAKGIFINKEILEREYLGYSYDLFKAIRNNLKDSALFDHSQRWFMNRQEIYARNLQQAKIVQDQFLVSHSKDLKDPMYKLHANQFAAEFDVTLHGKLGVHLGLYVDTLKALGSDKHNGIRDRAYDMKDYGCFALTELGHGSNIAGLETTATYDHKAREFVLNSPTRTSAKWWIGAAAKTANMAVVWAQMVFDGENKGVHAFAVEIRDYHTHVPKAGVVVGDCGKKIELDGIDNGFLLFKNYRVKYDCFLDYYAQITEDGKFKSSIKNKDKRLAVMLGAIMRGRIGVVTASEAGLRNALTIAIRFASVRKQFGEPGSVEKPIISYQLHKFRLMPLLARLFAIRSGQHVITRIYNSIFPTLKQSQESEELAEFHAILSFIKAYASSNAFAGIQECRESCGGLGFSAYAGLGRLRNTTDVLLTWEGDNNVLLQQTSRYILKQLQRSFKGAKSDSKTLTFLRVDYEDIKWAIKCEKDITLDNLNTVLEQRVCYHAKESILKLQHNAMTYPTVTEAWNNSQVNHLALLAKFYGEGLLFKEFRRMAHDIHQKCSVTGEFIFKLCELFALDCLERNQRGYLELGCTLQESNMIRDRHLKNCEEIAEVSLNIIESVAVSDRFLGSALGHSDGQVYERLIGEVEAEKECYIMPPWIEHLQAVRNSK